jgi:hypothetical protein
MLTDTPAGLNFVCKLNKDSQAHRDLYASVSRGDLSECSFAFVVDGEDGQSFSRPDLNGLPTRTIKRAKLLDVSVVANPAYGNGATQVDARARVTADDQAAIKRQIVAWNARKKENLTRARAVMAEYPELDAETISRGRRLGYSEDTMLSLRFAAITKNMRNEPAQSADPQQVFAMMMILAGMMTTGMQTSTNALRITIWPAPERRQMFTRQKVISAPQLATSTQQRIRQKL